MDNCWLTVYKDRAVPAFEGRVELPALPNQWQLERIYRENMVGVPCRYAIVRDDHHVRALYLPTQYLPPRSVRIGTTWKAEGRWVTSLVQLGDWGGGRALIGPEIFFRQIDLDAEHAWLAPILMQFGSGVDVEAFEFDDTTVVYSWEHLTNRYFYISQGRRWALYGAGNTPSSWFNAAIDAEEPETPNELFWAVGAIRLSERASQSGVLPAWAT